MIGLKKRRRIQVISVAFVALAVATGLIGYGLRDGINLYRSPSQVAEAPPVPAEIFKLGGLVMDGSRTPAVDGQFSFIITDCLADIPVDFVGSEVPDLFAEGQGTIATGQLVDGRFQATTILAKHDESYQPVEVTDTLSQEGACQNPEG